MMEGDNMQKGGVIGMIMAFVCECLRKGRCSPRILCPAHFRWTTKTTLLLLQMEVAIPLSV